jgi:hypothetical protein
LHLMVQPRVRGVTIGRTTVDLLNIVMPSSLLELATLGQSRVPDLLPRTEPKQALAGAKVKEAYALDQVVGPGFCYRICRYLVSGTMRRTVAFGFQRTTGRRDSTCRARHVGVAGSTIRQKTACDTRRPRCCTSFRMTTSGATTNPAGGLATWRHSMAYFGLPRR